jgi:hypothetical protein
VYPGFRSDLLLFSDIIARGNESIMKKDIVNETADEHIFLRRPVAAAAARSSRRLRSSSAIINIVLFFVARASIMDTIK